MATPQAPDRAADGSREPRGGAPMPMGLSEASNILWRQRHLLELLLFTLDVEQTLLPAGRLRWLARATNEVELVLEQLLHTKLDRPIPTHADHEQHGHESKRLREKVGE